MGKEKKIPLKELERGYNNFILLDKVKGMFNRMVVKEIVKSPPKNAIWIERVDFHTVGTFTYYRGCDIPLAGCPHPDIVARVDEMKKNAMAFFWGLRNVLKNRLMGILFLVVFRKQAYEFCEAIITSLWENIVNVRVKKSICCSAVREVWNKWNGNKKLRDIVVMGLEFDTAYRFRFQWAVSQIDTKALTNNCVKELQRVLGLLCKAEREPSLITKFQWISKIIIYLNYRKDLKQKVINFFNSLNIKKVTLSKADLFHAKLKNKFIWQ